MIIELPEFNFEKPCPNSVIIESLFDKVGHLLDTKGVNRDEYAVGSQITAGLGELVIQSFNDFWVVYTTERGKNFDISVFSNVFHAINYFIFRLTGDNETIDWSMM